MGREQAKQGTWLVFDLPPLAGGSGSNKKTQATLRKARCHALLIIFAVLKFCYCSPVLASSFPSAPAGGGFGGGEPPLPPNWALFYDHDGQAYYYNQVDGRRQWEHPGGETAAPATPAPAYLTPHSTDEKPGIDARRSRWYPAEDAHGRVYYVDSYSGLTSYQPPPRGGEETDREWSPLTETADGAYPSYYHPQQCNLEQGGEVGQEEEERRGVEARVSRPGAEGEREEGAPGTGKDRWEGNAQEEPARWYWERERASILEEKEALASVVARLRARQGEAELDEEKPVEHAAREEGEGGALLGAREEVARLEGEVGAWRGWVTLLSLRLEAGRGTGTAEGESLARELGEMREALAEKEREVEEGRAREEEARSRYLLAMEELRELRGDGAEGGGGREGGRVTGARTHVYVEGEEEGEEGEEEEGEEGWREGEASGREDRDLGPWSERGERESASSLVGRALSACLRAWVPKAIRGPTREEEAMESLNRTVARLRENGSALMESLESRNSLIEELHQRVECYEEEGERRRKTIRSLRGALAELTEEVNAKSEEAGALRRELKGLVQELLWKDANMTALSTRVRVGEARIGALEAEKARGEGERASVEAKASQIAAALGVLEKEVEELRREAGELRNRTSEQLGLITGLEEEKRAVSERLKEAMAAEREALETADALRVDKERLGEEKDALSQEKALWVHERGALEAAVKAAETEVREREEREGEMAREREELKRALADEREKQGEERRRREEVEAETERRRQEEREEDACRTGAHAEVQEEAVPDGRKTHEPPPPHFPPFPWTGLEGAREPPPPIPPQEARHERRCWWLRIWGGHIHACPAMGKRRGW